jgi:DNA-binding CsgD family transcriptional regulator
LPLLTGAFCDAGAGGSFRENAGWKVPHGERNLGLDASINSALGQFLAIHEIIGECLELWADPAAWQTHLLRRAAKLVDCRLGIYYEIEDVPDEVCSKIVYATDAGWSRESERRTLIEGIATKKLSYSPLWSTFASDLTHAAGKTLRQRAVIRDRPWHKSEMYDHHIRPTELGEAILSAIWMPQLTQWSMWCVANDRSDRTLTAEQEEWIGLLHRLIAPLIGTRLCTFQSLSMEGLSLRRREVLGYLLSGQSEKQVAARMHRSAAAVHEHVSHLYRHFGVDSRGELAAYFIQRRPINDPSRPRFDLLANWLER